MLKSYYYIIIIFLISCNAANKKKANCAYSIDELYKNYDSTKMQQFEFKKDNKIDVIEKGNMAGERGIYSFDQNNILRFYAFLINDSNDYFYSVEYDSLGNDIKQSGSDVVRWYVKDYSKDSLKVTFLLYSLNQSYRNINLKNGSFEIKDIKPTNSEMLSNIVGKIITLPKDKRYKTIFLTGIKTNTCTNQTKSFSDSVFIPFELLE